jgi:hypothetical protein
MASGGARRCAIAAASRLFGASSFRRMCETWTLAVLTLMTSASVFGTRLEHSAAPDDLIHALPAQSGHLGNDARGVTLRMGLQNRGVKLATRVAQPRL